MTGSNTSESTRERSGWTGGRIVGTVASSLLALLGIALLLGGLALIAAYTFARDDDGYLTTDTERLHSPGYALTAEDLDLGGDPADWAPEDLLGTVRVDVESLTGRPAFVGIGPRAEVDRYLGDAGRSEVTDFANGAPRYEVHPGGGPPSRPGAQDFWASQSEGRGLQRADWDVEGDSWSVVVMNADASRGIAVDAEAGVKVEWIIWVGVGFALVGLVLTVVGVLLILRIARRAARLAATAAPAA